MPDYAEDHFSTSSAAKTPAPEAGEAARRESRESYSEDEPSSLVDGVAYLSLCASGTTDTAPEPFYLGSSSGATIARMIQSSIFHGAGGRALSEAMAATQPGVLSPPPPPPRKTASVSSHPDEMISEFPYFAEAKMLFDVFFDRLHTRWPILDRKLYTTLFEQQYDHGSLSIQQRSIMHLVYAISARFLQLMKKPCDVDPQVRWMDRRQYLGAVRLINSRAATSHGGHRADGLHPRAAQPCHSPVPPPAGRPRHTESVRRRGLVPGTIRRDAVHRAGPP